MIEKTLELLKDASYSLPVLEENQINDLLLTLADAIESNSAVLLEANAKDLARMDRSNPVYARRTRLWTRQWRLGGKCQRLCAQDVDERRESCHRADAQ